MAVVVDTSDSEGREVVAGTNALSEKCVGVYTGTGGSGSATTVTGLTGNDAAAGDIILVKYKGYVKAIGEGGTVDIVAGDQLEVIDGGKFDTVGADATIEQFKVIATALEGITADGNAGAIFLL